MPSTHGSTETAAPVLLRLRELSVAFATPAGPLPAVDAVSLQIAAGECVAVVGESGSGKTQLFLACLGLLAANGAASGSARFGDTELIGASERELNRIRGVGIGLVLQDPMNALTPHLRIELLLTEGLLDRALATASEARARALQALQGAGIDAPQTRLRQYPYELSGGMRQRVAIAVALMSSPQMLIADEPTTALDVTVQARILERLRSLRDAGLAVVVITHDIGVAAALADRVAVMYAGRLVEIGPAGALLAAPAHPYTAALLASVPRPNDPPEQPLGSIEGQPPRPGEIIAGCPFAPRCAAASEICRELRPVLRTLPEARQVACHAPFAAESAP